MIQIIISSPVDEKLREKRIHNKTHKLFHLTVCKPTVIGKT
jgi:hypothetical protein